MRLPISDLLLINSNWLLTSYLVPFRSYRSLLCKIWHFCVFEPPPPGGLETTYDVDLGLILKRVVDFLLVLTELFCYVLRLRRY